MKYAHSGEIWGFSGSHAYYPERDTTIVVLSNRMGPVLTPVSLERQVARIVLSIPAPTIDMGTLPAAALARYSGEYALSSMRIGTPTLSFAARDGQLYFAFGSVSDPNQMLPLHPAGHDRFVLADDPKRPSSSAAAGRAVRLSDSSWMRSMATSRRLAPTRVPS